MQFYLDYWLLVSVGSYVTAPIDVAAYHILRSFESSAATGFFKIMTNMVHPVSTFSNKSFDDSYFKAA